MFDDISPPPRTWTPARAAAAVAAVLMLALGLGIFSAQASAMHHDLLATGLPGHLQLSSDHADPDNLVIETGAPTYWEIDADLSDERTSTLTLIMTKTGELAEHAEGLTVAVDRCDEHWDHADEVPACSGEPEHVVLATPLDDMASGSPVYDLAGIASRGVKHLLVTLSVGAADATAANAELIGLSGRIGFALTATGDDLPAAVPSAPTVFPAGAPVPGVELSSVGRGSGTLALTGLDAAALVLIGAGTVGLGLVLTVVRRSRTALTAHEYGEPA